MCNQSMTTSAEFPETWAITHLVRVLRAHLPDLAHRHHIRALGVFGSSVRNAQQPTSDLDVLVEFEQLPGLLAYAGLQHELSNLLGVAVDLVHRPDLKPGIGECILDEVVMLLLAALSPAASEGAGA